MNGRIRNIIKNLEAVKCKIAMHKHIEDTDNYSPIYAIM